VAEKRSDVEIVRDQITREVTNDAYDIAGDIFRQPEPDVARVSNDQIDARYRRAFEEGDRKYLLSEAQRDPRQFLEATKRLGVSLPTEPIVPEEPLPRLAQAAAPLPLPPPSAVQQATPVPPVSVPSQSAAPAPVAPVPAEPPAPTVY